MTVLTRRRTAIACLGGLTLCRGTDQQAGKMASSPSIGRVVCNTHSRGNQPTIDSRNGSTGFLTRAESLHPASLVAGIGAGPLRWGFPGSDGEAPEPCAENIKFSHMLVRSRRLAPGANIRRRSSWPPAATRRSRAAVVNAEFHLLNS
jgi:hypothetical protein